MGVPREEDEIFGQIEECAKAESGNEERKESDFGSWLRTECFVVDPKGRNGSEKKDGHLGADRAEGVGEALIGEKLWHEHDKEGSEEENVSDEAQVAVAFADPEAEESDGLPDHKEEASEKESPDKRIEYRIGSVVVAPVLVTPEIIFDE